MDDGCIYYEMGGNKEKLKCPLYSNFLKEPYNPLDTDTDANEYILEKELLNEIIYKTVMWLQMAAPQYGSIPALIVDFSIQ